ncbi:oligosaccharide flippase family protein [Pseudoalteromonas lipolytica]|uniref:oligosaccharide flippase family protein n=1 Tax=Pseudoalteromonas lipolytica TaxID=570156 RepID=UPI0030ABFFB7
MGKLTKGGFFRKFQQLATGSIAAQVITVAFSPLITRVFAPSELGELAFIISISTILSSFLTLKLDFSIPKKKSTSQANSILVTSIILLLISTIIVFVFVFLFDIFFELISLVHIFSVVIALNLALNGILVNYLNFYQTYKVIAFSLFINALFTSVLKVGLGYLAITNALVIATLLGGGVSIFILTLGSKKYYFKNYKYLPRNIIRDLRDNLDFVRFYLPSSIFSAFSMHIPVLLIGYYYGNYILGFYSLALRMLQMPIALIGSSLGKVYYREVTNLDCLDLQRLLTKKIILVLSLVGSVPIVVLSFYGEELFSFVFGVNWLTAGTIAEKLAPWIFLVLIFSPLSNILLVKDEQKKLLYTSLMLFLARSTIVVICYSVGAGFFVMFEAFAVVSVITWLLNAYIILSVLKFERGMVFLVLILYLAVSIYVILK